MTDTKIRSTSSSRRSIYPLFIVAVIFVLPARCAIALRRVAPWYIGVDQVEFAGPVAAGNFGNALQ